MGTTGTEHVGWWFLASKRWLGYFALLIIFSVACAMFGNWQFDRRGQARAEIARIDNNYDAEALPLAEVMPDPTSFDNDSMKWHPVTVTGTYDTETYLVRGRPGPAGVGSNLIQPLHLSDGGYFMVDRGWVPYMGADQIPADLPAPPSGEVTVEVRLRAGEGSVSGRTSVGRLLASVELSELDALTGNEPGTYTAAFGQLIDESPTTVTGILPDRPERDEGPHLSYALQWYVFIIIACIGVGYAARLEYRGLNAGSETVERQDKRRAERKKRRGPTDADEEDALLDA